MELSTLQNFQFADPSWLWGLVLLPVLWILYKFFYKQGGTETKLEEFADPHLLPHLMAEEGQKNGKRNRVWLSLLIWSLLWGFGLLAMAGPRWDYTEVKAFAPARNLVILLDLSRSMDAEDVKSSRLARARQEIEDINRLAHGMNIGLIAFASVPHVTTPLTDDRETLNRLLPSLKTDLVYTQGSNLSPALRRAGELLSAEPGREKHILVISDGGFQDSDAQILKAEKELSKQGISVHVFGLGTAQGAPVPDGGGGYVKENAKIVISRLEQDRLRRIAQDGHGLYKTASYLESDTQGLLSKVNRATESEMQKTTRFWKERFYLFLAPLALLLLPWFRRNSAFPILVFLLLQPAPAKAFEWSSLFLNKQQQGKVAIEQKRYDEAAQKFNDPYRRGVAQYKAGRYEEAAQSFTAADRPDISTDAQYNLGNAQLKNGKIKEAIASYENVLKDHPGHEDAAYNLEIARKMLEQQKKQQRQDNKQDQKQDGQQGDQKQQSQQQNQNQADSQQQRSPQAQNGADKSEQQRESGEQNEQKQQDENKKSESGDQDEYEQKNEERQQAQSGKEGDEQQAQQESKDRQQASENIENQDIDQTPRKAEKTQKDIDADQWLNRIQNNPETFLKNKFYIESKRQGAQQGDHPW